MSKFTGIFEAKKGAADKTAVLTRAGRPRGKRSDPRYTQVTAFIRKETHQNVKLALLKQGNGREFSELVEELLVEWLKKH